MSLSNQFIRSFKNSLPSPFSIAILLTLLSFVLAFVFTTPQNTEEIYVFQLLEFWEKGFWELLKFAMQMMLMLVLGHVLANTQFITTLTQKIAKLGTNTAKAALLVTLFTLLVSLFNWGLGLIFGAILARKTGEFASQNGIKLNYPLIGAAGYSGLMVWHGGLSGSAPLKVAESGHFLIDKIGQSLFYIRLRGDTYYLTQVSPVGELLLLVQSKSNQKEKTPSSSPFGRPEF